MTCSISWVPWAVLNIRIGIISSAGCMYIATNEKKDEMHRYGSGEIQVSSGWRTGKEGLGAIVRSRAGR